MGDRVRFRTDEGSGAERVWQLAPSGDTWPRVAVLLIGDGRDETRAATLDSFLDNVHGYCLTHVVEVDDRHHEMGFAGAIRAGWHYLRQHELDSIEAGEGRLFDYIFHLEEDWRFLRPVNLRELSSILDSNLPLAQVALRRGPVNAEERAAGGVVEMWPEEYRTEYSQRGHPYLQHDLYFTTNPCLYRPELMVLEWPDVPGSEAAFTEICRAVGMSFALFGSYDALPLVTHTGTRTGTGY